MFHIINFPQFCNDCFITFNGWFLLPLFSFIKLLSELEIQTQVYSLPYYCKDLNLEVLCTGLQKHVDRDS